MIGDISGENVNYVDGTTNPPSCSGRCAQLSAELERERSRLAALQLAYDKATAMLDRVTDERDELRRTLDDAAHELEAAEERIAKRLDSELEAQLYRAMREFGRALSAGASDRVTAERDELRAENDRLRNGWRDGGPSGFVTGEDQ